MKKFIYTSVLAVLTLMTACQKEEQNSPISENSDKIAQLKKDLSGYAILGQHVKTKHCSKAVVLRSSLSNGTRLPRKWEYLSPKHNQEICLFLFR